MQREFGPQGLVVVAIDIKEPEATVANWVKASRTSIPVVLDADGQVARQYEVRVTPTSFLIGRDGSMVGKALGTKPWTSEAGRTLLRALTAS